MSDKTEIDIVNLMVDVHLVMDYSYDKAGLHCFSKKQDGEERTNLFSIPNSSPYHDVVKEFVEETFSPVHSGIGWIRKTEEEKRIFESKTVMSKKK